MSTQLHLTEVLFGFSIEQIALAIGLFVVSTVVTTAIVAAYLVLLEPDHFVSRERGLRRKIESPALSIAYLIGKNLLGAVLVVVGVVLSLPGIPGQGLLTILVGLLLLDIPGKRRLELALVRRRSIRRVIDKVRDRFDKPPILTHVAEGSRALDAPRQSGGDDIMEP